MIRHQQFQESTPDALDVVGGCLHLHTGLDVPDTGGSVDALANVDHTQAADSYWFFVLLMTECGNGDAAFLSRFEDRGGFAASAVNNERFSVDRDLDLLPGNKCCREILFHNLATTWEANASGTTLRF